MNSTEPIRVLIADDHPVTCEGLAAMLNSREELNVVGQARNGKEAVNLFHEHRPDVLVLDVNMPHLTGLEVTAQLHREFPRAVIVLLSFSDAEETIYQAFMAGAKAYLLKDMDPKMICSAIVDVHAGCYSVPADVASKLAQRVNRLQLTAREREILGCLATGMSNAEIGSALFIAEGTVKVHVCSILSKLQVSDRTQAVTAAIKRGLVQLA